MSILLAGALLAIGSPAILQGEERETEYEERMNQVVCKRDTETGTLIARRKVCLTRAEWAAFADSQQTGARRMVEELRTKPSGEKSGGP